MRMLDWAVRLEKMRTESGLTKRVTLLVVTSVVLFSLTPYDLILYVSHDALAEDQSQILQYADAFDIGAYAELWHTSTPNPWQDFLYKDLVIVSAKVCLCFWIE
jgi:hypothetical protein